MRGSDSEHSLTILGMTFLPTAYHTSEAGGGPTQYHARWREHDTWHTLDCFLRTLLRSVYQRPSPYLLSGRCGHSCANVPHFALNLP